MWNFSIQVWFYIIFNETMKSSTMLQIVEGGALLKTPTDTAPVPITSSWNVNIASVLNISAGKGTCCVRSFKRSQKTVCPHHLWQIHEGGHHVYMCPSGWSASSPQESTTGLMWDRPGGPNNKENQHNNTQVWTLKAKQASPGVAQLRIRHKQMR